MKRTGYDADTRQYTFHDSTTGVQFISAPGEKYGTLLPAATANYVKPKRGPGRRLTRKYFLYADAISLSHTRTVQAYERPVLFAEDVAQAQRPPSGSQSRSHKSAPKSPTSRSATPSSPHSGSTRRSGRGHGRNATFADILPANLIDRAAPSEPKQPQLRSWPMSKSATVDEKGHRNWPQAMQESRVESVSRHYPGDKGGTRDALRSTARVLGRSLTTVRGPRSHERERDHDGYVLV